MRKRSPILRRRLAVAVALLLAVSTVLVWRATRQPADMSGNPAPAREAVASSATVGTPQQTASREASASAASKKATGANALMAHGGATAPPAEKDQATSGGGTEDRYANNVVMAERETPIVIGGERRIKRLRLVRDETFKYPLVRVEDEFRDDPAGRVLLRQTAMVGDHVMVKLKDPKMDEATLLAQLNHAGAKVRRKMPASGVWLVAFPEVDLDAVPTTIAALARLDGLVRYAEPDYIAYTTATPNDSSFASLWGMHNVGQVAGSIAKVQVELLTIGGAPLTRSPSTPGVVGTLHDCGIGNPGDFPWQVAGNIAVIQRGTLTFATKVTNAMAAGAVAVIIYNNVAGDFSGDLVSAGPWVPTLGISQANGAALLGYPGDKTARVTIGGTSTVDADIDAPEAWELSTGSTAVKVGVIDSGIDLNHPDLAANIWVNPAEIPGNGVDDDGNGYIDDTRGWDFANDDNLPMDDNFHGTHCAGTIGGVGNNGAGVAGVCWTVSLIPLKNSNSDGFSATSDSQEAVAYATAIGVNLTSNSYGGGPFTQSFKDAIDAANAAGILFVASAGNNNRNTDDVPSYPASYDSPNVISVAATTSSETRSSFSNYGLTTVDLGAPGSAVYSTFPTVQTSAMASSGFSTNYQSISGTSMAAPHVAGACALLKSFRPSLTHLEIKNAILSSVDVIPAMTGITVTGGRLNVHAALVSLDALTVSPIGSLVAAGPVGGPFPPSSHIHTLTNTGTAAALTWTASTSVPWMSVSPAGGTLAPGASTTVTMTFNSAASSLAVGTYAGSVTFSDVTNAKVLTRSVTLSPEGPEIVVEQPAGTGLGDGVGSQGFGTVSVSGSSSRTFTIRNLGAGSLTGLSVSKSGTHSADFTVGSLGATTLAFDASTTFTVTFAPGAAGTRNAAIHIASNDSDENPFDIELNGTGLTPGVFTNFQDASVIIGQPNFTTQLSTASQSVTPGPSGCAISATGKLAVSDQTGQRVLIWNSIPTTSGVPADVVVGKANFTDTAGGTSASLTRSCNGVAFSPDGQKLLVSDSGNHRVLIWNTVPTTNGVPADVVIGQTSFTTVNQGLSATQFNGSSGLLVTQSGRLLVADAFNNRVLIFNSIPTSNGAAADVVIGQGTMTTKTAGAAASEMNFPWSVAVTADGRLLVAEYGNNRVLVFGSVPTTNGASASVVIGQSAFGLSGSGTSATTMGKPLGVHVSPAGVLAVSDYENHRVLIFNSVPATNGAAADFVLGQPDFASGVSFNGGVSARSMFRPRGLVFAPDGRLLVAGNDMKRVMVFGSPVPEIAVEQPPGTGLTDGTATRDFGTVPLSGNASRTFTVRNFGGANLTGLSVSKSGTHSADFTVGALGATALAPGTSTIFTVTFAPGSPGLRTAAIQIASNDFDENPFDIALNGSGALPLGTVSTNSESGPGSLREAIAGVSAGTTITFAPNLSGATILLTSGELQVNQNLTIDASALPGGLTISGGGVSRVFSMAGGTTVTLDSLAVTGGNAGGQTGGGLLTTGVLVLNRCTFFGNTALEGGAVRCAGGASSLTATNCTFSGNTAQIGGAMSIADGGPAAVLSHVTIVGNTATNSRGGGGIFFFDKASTLSNCLVAGNASPSGLDVNGSPSGPDIKADQGAVISPAGANLIGRNDTISAVFPAGPLVGTAASPLNPQLATLGNYGGSTQTRPPLPGSPAINAAVASSLPTDQRGRPRPSGLAADIGAVEFVPAEIAVEHPAGTDLVDGTASINFGMLGVGIPGAGRTFIITNRGDANLTLTNIAPDGPNAGDFAVVSPGATTLTPGTSMTFTVTFTPGAAGARNATLRIASNDPDETSFDIALTGTGLTHLQAWRLTHFGSAANSGDGADANDYSKDGIGNLYEYAFGLNPTLSNADPIPRPLHLGGNLVASFTQPGNVSGIIYSAEWSPTLRDGSWTPIPDTGIPPQHIFSIPIGTQPRMFWRLMVTNPGTPISLAGATATQSSEFPPFPASNAIDGNLNSFTRTDPADTAPTWTLTLPGPTPLGSIVLHNRTDGSRERLRNITVQIFSDAVGTVPVFTSPVLNPNNVLNGPATLRVPTGNVTGRVIRVSRGLSDNPVGDDRVLSLGEVQLTSPGP